MAAHGTTYKPHHQNPRCKKLREPTPSVAETQALLAQWGTNRPLTFLQVRVPKRQTEKLDAQTPKTVNLC